MGERRPGPWVLVLGALIVVVSGSGCIRVGRPQPTTTVLLVRHAERDNGSLNEAGLERAQELAHVALKAGATAVYTTDTERTRLTARPAADRLDLVPLIYEVDSENRIEAFAARLQSDHAGEVVLVVGHNPTVPETIEALGGDPAGCSIGSAYEEYDDLCIVTIYGPGRVKVVNLQYGKPSPAGSEP